MRAAFTILFAASAALVANAFPTPPAIAGCDISATTIPGLPLGNVTMPTDAKPAYLGLGVGVQVSRPSPPV